MKKLALAFLVFFGLASLAQAQNSTEPLHMPLSAACFPTKTIDKELASTYNEIPFAQGVGVVFHSLLEDYLPTRTRIFINPETYSFSVVIDIAEDNLSCIVITGERFQPVQRKK